MNFEFMRGVAAVCVLLTASYLLYRLYKRVGRRCKNCGEIFGGRLFAFVQATFGWLLTRKKRKKPQEEMPKKRVGIRRKHKIFLPADETAPFISVRSPKGHFRWWIRRTLTVTYSTCGCGWREIEKISRGPLSLWHILWIWYTDREQFYCDEEAGFSFTLNQFLRDVQHNRIEKGVERDALPMRVGSVFCMKDGGVRLGDLLLIQGDKHTGELNLMLMPPDEEQ